MMIDRTARNKTASAIRGFATGRITNDDMENSIPQSNDPIIYAIDGYAWTLFDDLKTHRARGRHALSKSDKKTIARCILFLQSNEDYAYPEIDPYDNNLIAPMFFLLNLLTLGLLSNVLKGKDPFQDAGDTSVWPFISRKQLGRVSQKLLYEKNTVL